MKELQTEVAEILEASNLKVYKWRGKWAVKDSRERKSPFFEDEVALYQWLRDAGTKAVEVIESVNVVEEAEKMKTLSEKVNKYLQKNKFAIKMEPGQLWFVADLMDRDWCVSPKLSDLEELHNWVIDNYRRLEGRRLEQDLNA